MNQPQRIVIATDFSAPATLALERSIELARHFDAELHITHVFSLPIPIVGVYDFSIPETGIQEARLAATRRLDEAEEKARAAGVQAVTHLVSSPTEQGISELARRVGADWIVVGTHGHTGLKHVVLGSVAERVVRHAPCSVLVIRDEDAQRASE
jgi:universal stress protein A